MSEDATIGAPNIVEEHPETQAERLAKNCDVPSYADPLWLGHPATFLLYMFGVIWVLVGIRVVSERYFARAIEGMIHKYKIPASIAGATLMAAGTSTPELISATVGVFLSTNSDTGSGTVLGSVIFNHLCIIGLAILVSPGQILSCSPFDISRDVLAWAITIGLFCAFFADGKIVLGEAWGFVIAYVLYVVLCGNWMPIDRFLKRMVGWKDPNAEDLEMGAVVPDHEKTVSATTFGNPSKAVPVGAGEHSRDGSNLSAAAPAPAGVSLSADAPPPAGVAVHAVNFGSTPSSPKTEPQRTGSIARMPSGTNPFSMLPSFTPRNYALEATVGPMAHMEPQEGIGFGGVMYRMSLDMERERSGGLSNRTSRGSQDMPRPRRSRGSQDMQRARRTASLDIENKKNLSKSEVYSTIQEVTGSETVLPDSQGVQHEKGGDYEEHDEEELTPFEEYALVKEHGSMLAKAFFWFEALWVLLVWCTNGWLRKNKWYLSSFALCCGWLTFFCIYLIFWLEKAGCVVGISAAVMGTVFGAAGTSIPDCLCSLYIARKGGGEMALTNVWGSNVFDLLFALGVLWVLSIHVYGKDIEVTNSEGLSIWMGVLLGIFIIQAIVFKCTFGKWQGYAYLAGYAVFIIYNFLNNKYQFSN